MCDPVEVLVVDDLPANRLALAGLLGEMDLQIVQAESGNDALTCMLEHEFAVVLLDVRMPGMDGFEVARLMRGTRRLQAVPIIFLTADSTAAQYVAEGYDVGAVDYLTKPLDPHVVRSKVAVFCELYRQRQQIVRQLEEIRTLRGFVPICMHCKLLRNDEGFWETVEVYIRENTEAICSHGLCPTCLDKYYPESENSDV